MDSLWCGFGVEIVLGSFLISANGAVSTVENGNNGFVGIARMV